jgi:hypothetical protein
MLFPSENTSSPRDDPLIGLVVELQDPCKCGAFVVVVGPGKGPHLGSLRCSACDGHRGWLARQTRNFISESIKQSGRSADPIKVQRAA